MATWMVDSSCEVHVHVSVLGFTGDLDTATHKTVSLIFFIYWLTRSCGCRKSEK